MLHIYTLDSLKSSAYSSPSIALRLGNPSTLSGFPTEHIEEVSWHVRVALHATSPAARKSILMCAAPLANLRSVQGQFSFVDNKAVMERKHQSGHNAAYSLRPSLETLQQHAPLWPVPFCCALLCFLVEQCFFWCGHRIARGGKGNVCYCLLNIYPVTSQTTGLNLQSGS